MPTPAGRVGHTTVRQPAAIPVRPHPLCHPTVCLNRREPSYRWTRPRNNQTYASTGFLRWTERTVGARAPARSRRVKCSLPFDHGSSEFVRPRRSRRRPVRTSPTEAPAACVVAVAGPAGGEATQRLAPRQRRNHRRRRIVGSLDSGGHHPRRPTVITYPRFVVAILVDRGCFAELVNGSLDLGPQQQRSTIRRIAVVRATPGRADILCSGGHTFLSGISTFRRRCCRSGAYPSRTHPLAAGSADGVPWPESIVRRAERLALIGTGR